MLKKAFQEFGEQIEQPEISMTPLIDMIFILLIFFVVTTTFTKETGIKVEKAKAETAQIVDNNMIIIAIDSADSYHIHKEIMALEKAINTIHEEYLKDDKKQVVIVPDKRASVEPLLTLMDKLQQKEIYRYTIGAKQVVATE